MKKVILIIVIIGILVAGFAVIGSQRFLDDIEGIISFVPPAKFGGINLINSDMSDGGPLRSAIGKVYGYSDTYPYEYRSSSLSAEYHINFALQESNISVKMRDVDIITFDMDLTLDLKDRIQLGALCKNSSGDLVSSNKSNSKFLQIVPSDDGSYELCIIQSSALKSVATTDSNFHLTIVYQFNHENYSDSVAAVYLDGKYVTSLPNFVSGEVSFVSDFRIHQEGKYNLHDDDVIAFSSYVVNAFERDYDGAIIDALEDPSIDLQDCPDSVLYRS